MNRALERALPAARLSAARDAYDLMRFRAQSIPLLPTQAAAWWRARTVRSTYRVLTEEELRATRKTDTVFVFGSGASLNDLTAKDWEEIAKYDTLGFNAFPRQRFVRCDYHLVREVGGDDRREESWRPELEAYFERIVSNPYYRETVFLIQSGLRATGGNRGIGYRLLPEGSRIFRWRSRLGTLELSKRLRDGLTHGYGTLAETVNFAYLLGWKRIVLAGVDLYDRRYFWLPADEARPVDAVRGFRPEDPHATGTNLTVELFGAWASELATENVELLVQNPGSLLAKVLPVYRVGDERPRNAAG